MITHRPEHLKTFNYIGFHRYFLTFCTHERHRAFVTTERVDVVLAQFLRTSHEQQIALIAYCFMPDHVHLLAEGTAPNSDCLAFIARAKQFSGFHYSKTFGKRLWQRYGYERTLRAEEATLSVARYIVENPLRAGLAARAEDYPFLGSGVYPLEAILEAVQLHPGWSGSG